MIWKALFFSLLAVVVGLLWQYEEYRRMLFLEIEAARTSVNAFTARYEGWQVVLVSIGLTLLVSSVLSFLLEDDILSFSQRVRALFYRVIRRVPVIGGKINSQMEKAVDSMAKGFQPKNGETSRTELPKKGLTHTDVMKEIAKMDKLADIDWDEGWVSGGLYYGSPELTKLSTAVFEKYLWSNPLHLNVFPQINKMESEVVQWTAKLFNGGKDACGVMTSGGTESISLAMKAYREMGFQRGIRYPEIVCPNTAHPAFSKAAAYFRMKITKVAVDSRTQMVDMKAMARAISSSTVVLVGSAPQFPHGAIDPIEDIAKLALKHDIGMHVDCCLGGFILPFMEKAGFKLNPFDFRVKGLTSISADTHKYGYTPKGTSVLLYSNKELRQKQYFVESNWQGGVYATASMGGSRPGCLIAATWATLMYMGEEGYVNATRRIVETTRKIVKALEAIPGIRVMGKPKAMVFAFDSTDIDILRVSEALKKKGWSLNLLQFPFSIHLCVTMVHTKEGVADRLVNDIKQCTEEVKKNPKTKATGQAAFYGMAASIPDRSIVNELAREYLDLMHTVTPPSLTN